MVDRYVNYDIGLKAMTDLLKKAVDFFSEGIVYCVDTEKFIVVLPETNIENAVEMSESFCSENKRPIYIENLPVSVKLKSGIINYPESGTDLNVVLMNLDKALGYACRVQNDIVIYNEKLSSENSRYYNEIVSLYDALQKNKFMLVYQPKINIKNDGLEGVEALLRWNDSMHKDMSIEKLIKLAEDAGFIGEITRWVVKNTIKQIKIWNEKGISIKISINLSSIDLSDESFLFFFKDSMETNGISPNLIEFELTERAIFSDDKSMTYLLNKIKKYGMKISLDDYGTGYNSMKSFISFSSMFDYLKIDKVFIDNIANPDNYELVSNIILCANKMGMKVIAEGIETEEQFRILREMGCDIVQGYYYSRPLPPEEIESFILNYGNSSCSAACDI
jgi:EAL domain-containing protein (putative c-di-GMP-specific phosphodiesterase class I)